MKANEMLQKIKSIVGVELSEDAVKFTEVELKNGTVLVAEAFEAGQSVFIKSDEEEIALPVGEYELSDDTILVVEDEGVIKEIKAKTEEVEASEEIEAAEEDESRAEKADWAKSYEELKDRVDNLEDAIADLKADKQPREEKAVEASKEEILETTESTEKTEMAAVAEPVKHSPEVESDTFNFKISGNRVRTTKDKVFEKLFNN